ncbi:MAG TPA: amylo-alpha-1,6-glucosidase [Tepidisphaeraceae bacterium]|nr:amylo-alpha-1,6-glucosidase [Tepidisphaeraceae bacterium]
MDRIDVDGLGFDGLIRREWLSANGLGGYASSTVCGMNTRKYHGLLVAAMAPPVRRMVILSRIDERIYVDGNHVELACNEYPGTIFPQGYKLLRAFSPEPFPRWAYQSDGFTLEKSVRLLPGQNTVCASYTLLAGDKPVDLELRPLLALRPIHELMFQWHGRLKTETRGPKHLHIGATTRTPEVFFAHNGEFMDLPVWYLNTIYRREQERGYAGLEDLWMPGIVGRRLEPGQTVHLVCSTENVDLDRVLGELGKDVDRTPANHSGDAETVELSHAGAIHIVSAPGETAGKRRTAVITHYPWSTPSIRGAMISLTGLFLIPGRHEEARALLESTAELESDGLLPSELPEDSSAPIYHGADVALWFINAVHQYFNYTADSECVRRLMHVMDEIIEHYRHGTRLGIMADEDGLISSYEPGLATTWMDAKLVDWVVTPRHGRPVEINALWHNALRIVADFHQQFGSPDRHRELNQFADTVKTAFNRRFWNEELDCLYDVVQDQMFVDRAVRPNQIFAISLPHPALFSTRFAPVIDVVVNELLTPMGVRTLSPRDSAYLGRYEGDVIRRDRAYHQGSAYPWLLGPLVTAIVKARGRTGPTLSLCEEILRPIFKYIRGDGLGLICELFDGDSPQRPGGALSSAPAAAELLRCWHEDVLGVAPAVVSKSENSPQSVAAAK